MDFFKAVGRIILSAAMLRLLCLRPHSGIISHLAIPAEKKSENFRNLSAAKKDPDWIKGDRARRRL
jgi:hypothetical protein